MRVSLNLASHPYVELGPIYLRLRVLIALLALLAVPLWLLVHAEKQKADLAHTRLTAVLKGTAALQQQRQNYEADMRQPQNEAVLRQSQFLNRMFQQKAFSWTAVMMDLENVLPMGVQVENIDPAISRSGDVIIHLRVNGQHDRAVDLVRNLEHSRRFLLPRLVDETAETSQASRGGIQPAGFQSVNFDILADYNPLPMSSENRHSKSAAKHKAKTSAHVATKRTKRRKRRSPGPQKTSPQKTSPQKTSPQKTSPQKTGPQ